MNDVPVTAIVVTPSEKEIKIGEEISLDAIVYPDDATDKTIGWLASNDVVIEIYVIDNTCNVIGKVPGESYVFAISNYDNSIRGYSTITVLDDNLNYYPFATRNLPNDNRYTSFNDIPRRTTGIRINNQITLFEPLKFGEKGFNVEINSSPAKSGIFNEYNGISSSLYDQTFNYVCNSVSKILGEAVVNISIYNDQNTFLGSYQLESPLKENGIIKFDLQNFGELSLVYDGSLGDITNDMTSSVIKGIFNQFESLIVKGYNTIGNEGNIRYRSLDGLKQVPIVESKVN